MAFVKVSSFPYELTPRVSPRGQKLKESRYGCLLRFEFKDEGMGYSDLHPWVEFGDESLEAHLDSLKTSSPTQLAARAMENAYQDARARFAEKTLISKVSEVMNNALITEILAGDVLTQVQAFEKKGYEVIKIKIGDRPQDEISNLKKIIAASQFMIRLDANAKLNLNQAQKFLAELTEEERARIEYFEDPCPFKTDDWNQLRKQVPIALDWEARAALAQGLPVAWDVIVVKPSRQNLNFWLGVAQRSNSVLTVTSAMDHPLGVMQALVNAAEMKNKFPRLTLTAGCQTMHIYEDSAFSAWLRPEGPHLIPQDPLDAGLGFTALLESLAWS